VTLLHFDVPISACHQGLCSFVVIPPFNTPVLLYVLNRLNTGSLYFLANPVLHLLGSKVSTVAFTGVSLSTLLTYAFLVNLQKHSIF